MSIFKLSRIAVATAIASGVGGIAALPASAVTVVDGKCVSVSAAHGCLYDGNIAPSTVSDTQNKYNIYNDTHASAGPDIALTLLFKSDDGAGFLGTLTGAGTSSGVWSTPGFAVSFLAVKASNQFVLYKLAAPASSGSWNTFDIPFRNNPHELSHLTFFGSAAPSVPEPASWALMIAGFGMVGAGMRRRVALSV